MTTPPETATIPSAPSGKQLTDAESALKDIGSDYKEKFGFSDPETGYAYKAPEGPQPRAGRVDLRVQERAAVDARLPPQGLRAL